MFQNFVKVQPPHIRWEVRSIERQRLVEQGGGKYYTDIDFAIVTPIGSRDSVEKEVVPWLAQLEFECNQMPPRFDREWLDKIRQSYEAWKKGKELPVEGTAIRNWPVASPAEVKRLTQAGIRTVEDLVNANQQTMDAIGMGSVSLKTRAEEWVRGQSSLGPLVEAVSSMKITLDELRRQNEELAATNKILLTEIAARDRILESRSPMMSPAERMEPRTRQKENNVLSTADEDAVAEAVGRSLG